MAIARATVDADFTNRFVRGAIIRFLMDCDDPQRQTRNKFGIVLNRTPTEEESLLAITTTNLKYFASGYFENDIVRIAPGSYGCFTQETVISLREVRPERLESLKTLYSNGQMTFEGCMDAADMTEIEQKIESSVLIEIQMKKRIL